MTYSKGHLVIRGPSPGKDPYIDDGGDYAIEDEQGNIIGEAYHCVGQDAYADAQANAQLWANAHRLVDALVALLEWYQLGISWADSEGMMDKEDMDEAMDALNLANDALARAGYKEQEE